MTPLRWEVGSDGMVEGMMDPQQAQHDCNSMLQAVEAQSGLQLPCVINSVQAYCGRQSVYHSSGTQMHLDVGSTGLAAMQLKIGANMPQTGLWEKAS